MRLGIPLIAFSACVLGGYAEVRPQTKNSPNGFDVVDKSGNIRKTARQRNNCSDEKAVLPRSGWAAHAFTSCCDGASYETTVESSW